MALLRGLPSLTIGSFCGSWALLNNSLEGFPKMYLERRPTIVFIKYLALKDLYERMRYESLTHLRKSLWVFVFSELRWKSEFVDDVEAAMRMRLARGDLAIENNVEDDKIKESLMNYIIDYDYDQSLIIWHIATNLCYHTMRIEKTEESEEPEGLYPQFCMQLSDYMLCLLIMQPTMMATITGIGEIVFYDTCAEVARFHRNISTIGKTEMCCEMLSINTDVEPNSLKGDSSKSVLFDACILAKVLKRLKEKKWTLMSKVWVELLSYAASHCKANNHIAQLNKGGEFLTFVWLLMAHVGLGEQFQIRKTRKRTGNNRAKLIIGK